MIKSVIQMTQKFKSDIESLEPEIINPFFGDKPSFELWCFYETFISRIFLNYPLYDENNDKNYENIAILEVLAKNRIIIKATNPFEKTKNQLVKYCKTIHNELCELENY